jgi:hypothetical protein
LLLPVSRNFVPRHLHSWVFHLRPLLESGRSFPSPPCMTLLYQIATYVFPSYLIRCVFLQST